MNTNRIGSQRPCAESASLPSPSRAGTAFPGWNRLHLSGPAKGTFGHVSKSVAPLSGSDFTLSPLKSTPIEFHPSISVLTSEPTARFDSSLANDSTGRFQPFNSINPLEEKSTYKETLMGQPSQTTLNPLAPSFKRKSPPCLQAQSQFEYEPYQDTLGQSCEMNDQLMTPPSLACFPVPYQTNGCFYPENVNQSMMMSGQVPGQMYPALYPGGMVPSGMIFTPEPPGLKIVQTSVEQVQTPKGSVHYYSYWDNGLQVHSESAANEQWNQLEAMQTMQPIQPVPALCQVPMPQNMWPAPYGLSLQVQPDQQYILPGSGPALIPPRGAVYRGGGNRIMTRRANHGQPRIPRYTDFAAARPT